MKLTELINLHNPETFIVDIYEAHNSTCHTRWETVGSIHYGYQQIGDIHLRILLEAFTYQEKFNVINIAFERMDEQGNWTTTVSKNNKQASKIIGCVSNAISSEIKLFDYDALVFFANDHVDSRMNIYNWLARRKMKELGYYKENIPLPDGRLCTIVFNSNIVDTSEFVEFIASLDVK